MTRTLTLSEDEARALETLLADGALLAPPFERQTSNDAKIQAHLAAWRAQLAHETRSLRDVYDRLTAPVPRTPPPEDVAAADREALTTDPCDCPSENDEWLCTRAARHTGMHVASNGERICARWYDGGPAVLAENGLPTPPVAPASPTPAAPAPMPPAEGLDWEAVEESTDEWLVWTPDTTGGVIGAGPTRDAAIANAVANLRATADAIEPPPAESSPALPAESPAARDYRLALRALEAEALVTGKTFEAEAAALGRAFATATHANPLESRALDLHRAALALRSAP